ncbi:TPA: hypothetical protein ACPVZG_000154 [Vibrio parahaemolyticus]|nr:hypothetical protein [Vibrio parahaemolyticus]
MSSPNNVVIDGVVYVPQHEIKPLSDELTQDVLKQLVSMRYFNEQHKMKRQAWDIINKISPSVAELSEEDAYKLFHQED